MQKKLIALAVAGLATTGAFAQTNVTIYGLLDASAYATSGNNNRATNYGFLSNAVSTSRLGFKGSEDLGNGLKAVFNLETELSMVSGQIGSSAAGSGAGNFTRAANVGLDSTLGTVLLGRQATPTYQAVAASDVLGANSGGLSNAWVYANVVSAANRIVGNTGAEASQLNPVALPNGFFPGVGYVSPVLAGVQVKAFTNFGQNTADQGFSAGGLRDIAVAYSGFGANVRATYQEQLGAAPSARVTVKNSLVGGDYTVAGVKIAAAWARTAFDNPLKVGDISTVTLGASYQMGKANVGISYTDTRVTTDNAGNNLANTANNAAKQYALLAKYALSKRTDAYLLGTYVANEGGANMNGLYTANQLNVSGADRVNPTSVAVGIRHQF